MIFLAATHSAQTPARTGIQTVTRSIAQAMPESAPVSWFARGRYLHTLKPEWAHNLGIAPTSASLPIKSPGDVSVFLLARGLDYRVPLDQHPSFRDRLRGSWLLMPELMDGSVAAAMIDFAAKHRMKSAAIFHDAIPLQRPDLTERTAAMHSAYLEALNKCTVVLAVSQTSAEAFREFGRRSRVRVCPLPAEFLGSPRVTKFSLPGPEARILCVSTLEPRKNHRALLAAFESAAADRPSLTLDLAGDRYAGAPEIADSVESAARRDPRIRWHQNPDGAALAAHYASCDFTVYPSILEGFGLPVMESLWFARPCICANFGVMSENAEGGGCMTVDVRDETALAGAIRRLATQPQLRKHLMNEAIARPLRTWSDYVGELRHALD